MALSPYCRKLSCTQFGALLFAIVTNIFHSNQHISLATITKLSIITMFWIVAYSGLTMSIVHTSWPHTSCPTMQTVFFNNKKIIIPFSNHYGIVNSQHNSRRYCFLFELIYYAQLLQYIGCHSNPYFSLPTNNFVSNQKYIFVYSIYFLYPQIHTRSYSEYVENCELSYCCWENFW